MYALILTSTQDPYTQTKTKTKTKTNFHSITTTKKKKKMGVRLFCFLALVAIFSCIAKATDPNQLQDFCVGTNDPHNACKCPIYSLIIKFLYI